MQSKLKKQTTRKDPEASLQFGVGNGEKVVEERAGKTNQATRNEALKMIRFFRNKNCQTKLISSLTNRLETEMSYICWNLNKSLGTPWYNMLASMGEMGY